MIKESYGLNRKPIATSSEATVPAVTVSDPVGISVDGEKSPKQIHRDRSVSTEFVSDDFVEKPVNLEKELGNFEYDVI